MRGRGRIHGSPNFIVSGRRAGACHATWRGRQLNKNDLCIFEIAASTNRYCGAVFRGVTLGNVKPKLRRLQAATMEALTAVTDAIRPGLSCEAADKVGRDVIKAHGFGKKPQAPHRLFDRPQLSARLGEGQIISIRKGEKRLLQKNMTFHLVPGCLMQDEMGWVTSASIRVTDTGCEILNTIPIKAFAK